MTKASITGPILRPTAPENDVRTTPGYQWSGRGSECELWATSSRENGVSDRPVEDETGD